LTDTIGNNMEIDTPKQSESVNIVTTQSMSSATQRMQKKINNKEIAPHLIKRAHVVFNFLQSSQYYAYTSIKKVQYIYNEADRWNQGIQDIVTCSRGCKWCCKIPVDVTTIETQVIDKLYGTSNIAKKHRKKLDKKHVDYCPFLERATGLCNIYDARPFNCRVFFSFQSPQLCKDEKPHLNTGGPMNGYGSQFISLLAYALLAVVIDDNNGVYVKSQLFQNEVKKLKNKLNKRIHDLREVYGTDEYQFR